jgi:hypothetical protein
MATIKRHLDDLQKIIEKQKQTPKEQLKELDKKIQNYKNVKMYNFKGQEITTNEEQQLLQARNILIDKIRLDELNKEIKEQKYNSYIDKNIKKEIEQELFNILNEYFIENEEKKHIVYKVLNKSNNKKDILQDVIDSYDIKGDLILVIYELYDKTLKKLYNFYKFDILEEQKTIKEKQEEQKQARKDLIKAINTSSIINLGISALITKCNKSKKKW